MIFSANNFDIFTELLYLEPLLRDTLIYIIKMKRQKQSEWPKNSFKKQS